MPNPIILEVAAPDSELYVLSRATNDERYRQSAHQVYALSRHGNASAWDSWAARRAWVIAGIWLSPIVFGMGSCFDVFPSGNEFWAIPLCFASIGLIIGYATDRRQQRNRGKKMFEAVFGRTVSIDGVDVGSLVRVEAHVPTRSVVLVTECRVTRLALATESDAVLLADALESAHRR